MFGSSPSYWYNFSIRISFLRPLALLPYPLSHKFSFSLFFHQFFSHHWSISMVSFLLLFFSLKFLAPVFPPHLLCFPSLLFLSGLHSASISFFSRLLSDNSRGWYRQSFPGKKKRIFFWPAFFCGPFFSHTCVLLINKVSLFIFSTRNHYRINTTVKIVQWKFSVLQNSE